MIVRYRCRRSVFVYGSGLVDERHDDSQARYRRSDHGDLAAGQAGRAAAALRSAQSVRQ